MTLKETLYTKILTILGPFEDEGRRKEMIRVSSRSSASVCCDRIAGLEHVKALTKE